MKPRAAVNGFMAQYLTSRGIGSMWQWTEFRPCYRRRISPVRPDLSLDQKYRLSFPFNGNGRSPLGIHPHLPGSVSRSEVLPGIRT